MNREEDVLLEGERMGVRMRDVKFSHVLVAVVTALLMAVAPAAARQVVDFARNSGRLRGYGPAAFVGACQNGALRGEALVSPDVGSEFQDVTGFSTLYGGPSTRQGTACHYDVARARKVAVGVYDVRAVSAFVDRDGSVPVDLITAVVTPQSAVPVIATYEPFNDDGTVYSRVHLTDREGNPIDVPFSIAVFDESGLPIP